MQLKYLPYAIIAGLLIIIFLLRECGSPTPAPKERIDTFYSTKVIAVPIPPKYYPAPYPVQTIDSYEVPAKVDTAKILADYYKLRLYSRTFGNDTIGKVTVTDSVTKNKLKGWSISGHWNVTEKTITIKKEIQATLRNKVYIGALVASNLEILTLIPSVSLITKNDRTILNIGYDPFQKNYYAGLQFKIRLSKYR